MYETDAPRVHHVAWVAPTILPKQHFWVNAAPDFHSTKVAKAISELSEFWGTLGAALGVLTVILGMRDPILRVASHLGATPGAIPGIGGTNMLHEAS